MTHRAVSHLCGDARKQTDGSRGLRLNGKRLCRAFGFAYLRLSNTVMAVVQDSNLIPFNLLSVQLFKPYLSLAIQFADEYTTFSRHCQQFSEICPRIRRGEFVPLNAALRRNSCAGEVFPIYSALPEQKLLLFPK